MQIYLSHVSFGAWVRDESGGRRDLITLAEDLGLDGVALSDRDLVGLSECDLATIERRTAARHLGIVIDANADLTLEDPVARRSEVGHLEALIDLAKRLAVRRMRIAIGGQRVGIQRILKRSSSSGSGGYVKRLLRNRSVIRLAHFLRTRLWRQPRASRVAVEHSIRALQALLPSLERCGVRLGIENHWGITTWPQDVVEIVRRIDSENLGTCPDFDNFPPGMDRYEGLSLLAPFAVMAHARSSRFEADGEEPHIDYGRCLGILRSAGFDDVLCVEFLGPGSPVVGARRARELIQRHLGALNDPAPP